MSATTFATIICTMNRPDDLSRALASLAACRLQPLEVIVSDDSPEADRRSEVVCCDRPGVRYQRGPRRGLGANRNAALVGVGADWVHFIDDDVTVPADFYGNALVACDMLKGPAVVSGHELKYNTGVGDLPVVVEPPHAGFWGHLRPAGPEGGNCVVINATLFPRALLKVADFDERLRYGCEEIDFSRHAARLGYRLIYAPALQVEHRPAGENRETYKTSAFASAVYAGLKNQLFYRRRPDAAFAFAIVAWPRMVINNIRSSGLGALPQILRQSGRGFGFLINFTKTRSERIEASGSR